MEKDKVAFRKKFGGYNKKDVNAYIIKENEKFLREKESLRSQALRASDEADELRAEASEIKASLNAANVELERVRDSLAEAESVIAALKEESATKDEEIARLTEALENERASSEEEKKAIAEKLEADYSRVVDSLKNNLDELKSTDRDLGYRKQSDDIFADATPSREVKLAAYDALDGEIDRILAYAREEATKIIFSAEQAARQIRTSARDSGAIKKEISSKSSSIIDEIKRMIKSIKQ